MTDLRPPLTREQALHTAAFGGDEPGGEWLDIRSSAATAGSRCALELELYRRTGTLAGGPGPAGARRFLAAASLAHAWRADLWERLLPVSVGLPAREELVVLAGPDADLLGTLDAQPAGGPDGPAGLLPSLLEAVYPALLAGYENLAGSADRVSDGPLALAAIRSADDLRRVLGEGLALRLASVGGGGARCGALPGQPAGVRETPAEGVAGPSLSGGTPAQRSDQTA